MCDAAKEAFGDENTHKKHGGLKKMGQAMEGGMVLVMSIWDDHAADMIWLDATDPPSKTSFGGPRGDCPAGSGKPATVEREHPDAHVIFSDIKIGDFGTTYHGGKPTPPGPGPTPSGCPGGSLSACIGLCPSNPPDAFKACVQSCETRCDGIEAFIQ
jgi:cellulose 1,4-beta-cellobiosidase